MLMDAAWPIRKLRDVAEVRVSNVDKKVHANEKPVKLCNYMDVYLNEYVTSKIQFMEASASAAEIERFGLNCGDVIITKDSETPDDIGIPTVIMEAIDDLVCGYHLALIRPNTDQLEPIYLAKQLSTSRVARYFALYASGSTRYGLPISAIKSIEIPTPPKPEQTKIAEVLSTVDRAIEQTEALIAKQQRIKTGLMQDLLTRGIDEHGNFRSEQTHKFKDSPLGRLPVEWEVERLTSVTSLIIDGTHFTPEYKDFGVPFLRVTDINKDVLTFENIKFISEKEHRQLTNRCKPEVDDILYSKNGTIGIPKIVDWEWDFSIFVSLALLKLDKNKVLPGFLQLILDSKVAWDQIRMRSKQGTVTNLHLEEIREFLIPVPLMKEQNEITRAINSVTTLLVNERQKREKLTVIKTALMQDLLTGKKRVTSLLNDMEVIS